MVIHGMGEQRPMNTLREFVDGVKWQMEQLDPTEKKVKVRSKADSVGDIYETVRLSMESNFKSRRPITDFYEFYWAHNMRGNTFGTASTWLKHVVFKWPGQIPPHLRHLWWKVWTIFIIAGLTALAISFFFQTTPLVKTVIAISSGALVSFIMGLMGSFVKSSFLNSLGDVARYFTPDPDNIGERSNIRQQGIAFLKKLHDISNITKPDRIIVVAHSLGSAVAYDFIRLLWAEYGPVYKSLPKEKQEALDRVNVFAQAPDTITGNYEAFADAQHDCWQECNAMGNPWLITDFITLGAAVNSLDYFMVSKVPSTN
ncbi:hypothetical protein MKQ70_02620 [Chitinophaga sedimenti]|uniref:hypothetical protein n=1 Tax=Chitinophaga sedimenti TaxID=2033606 RepID=UPI0020036D2D|nr:hypothetical protein [Chitinophaga sedimenti]MCK7553959.1 hypothetical protein [Chitinophaga sedimenti]